MSARRESERGMALAMSLLIMIVVFGISGSYLILSMGGWENSTRELSGVQARLGAEDGINLSIAELKSTVDTGGDGLGNLTATAPDGRVITVTALNLGPTGYLDSFLYQIHSEAALRRSTSAADLVAEIIPPQPIAYDARATITTNGPAGTTGSITIDGRDWNYAGNQVVGPGTYGISATGAITNSGASSIGGNGSAPSQNPAPGAQEALADWSDGVDQDADGYIDEESWDGIDNDGDELIDEDTSNYPSGPDVAINMPPGSLKEAAIASGTYFTNPAQLNAAIAANGGKSPGGVVIYCDFPLWYPADFGNQFNDPPSVFVMSNGGTATIKNVHGKFRGLIIVDLIDHMNGDVVFLGAMMSFAASSSNNSYGNGNATIRLCTAVLDNLPKAGKTLVKVRSWSRSAHQ